MVLSVLTSLAVSEDIVVVILVVKNELHILCNIEIESQRVSIG